MFAGSEVILQDCLSLKKRAGETRLFLSPSDRSNEDRSALQCCVGIVKRLSGARDGGRTRIARGREILSLLCLPISPPGLFDDYIGVPIRKRESDFRFPFLTGAAEESRTLDLNLGKVALYQLSYCRAETERAL